MTQKEELTVTKPLVTSPGIPWRTRLALYFISAGTDFSQRRDGTVNRRFLSFFDIRSPANPNPVNGVKSSDVTVDPSRNLWFRLFVPTDSNAVSQRRLPVVVFFHGGGFVYLSADTKSYDAVCRRFARTTPAVIVSVNYRLAPEHRYPAQHDDGFDVLKFLDENKNALPENADMASCFLAGDSAGGNLAHHVATRVAKSSSDFKKLTLKGLIAIQPFFGGEERTEAEIKLAGIDQIVTMNRTDWSWRALLGDGVDRDHPVINVSGPRAANITELDSFPPTLVVVAGFDSLKDWQRRYYNWLVKSGKHAYLSEYPTMVHAFYVFPEIPESNKLIYEVKDFIHKHCSM